jgi:hypothetical protein
VVRKFPLHAGIDFAGTVSASDDVRFRPGDTVLLNGFGVGAHASGYTAARYFLNASMVNFGADNLLALEVDATHPDGWWYDGGGKNPSLDAWGRPTPYVSQYPSAADGRGFFNLSSNVHNLGLRFGVWTVRGIPRAAVAAKTPIEGSPFTADEAASPATPCNWSSTCYGCATVPEADGLLRCNAAAYAYYRSLARWYVTQGVDVVKMDCMFPAQVCRRPV